MKQLEDLEKSLHSANTTERFSLLRRKTTSDTADSTQRDSEEAERKQRIEVY